MDIAVLAWGSLVWQRVNRYGGLNLRRGAEWVDDGPRLPVEFGRISADGRLTLVVLPGYASESRVLWAMSAHHEVDAARANLAMRETGAPIDAIHGFTPAGEVIGTPERSVIAAVADWIEDRPLDAAIWTGLSPGDRWVEFGYEGFTPAAAIDYVSGLRGEIRVRALEYVRRAPAQIDTPVRRGLSEITDR